MKIGKIPMGSSSRILDACRAVVIAAVLFWQPSNLQAGDNVVVASATYQSRVAAVSETIMARAYAALGYKLNVLYLPGKQALYKSNHGETDAELVRIEAVGRKYPNLVQVPEALFDVRGMAFSWSNTMRFQSAQDLWGRRVGIVKGIQWAAKIAEGQSPKLAENVHHLFELLANRQIDIALEAQLTGQPELKHFPNTGLVMLLETPIQFPVFHFLNKKHHNLIAPLAEEIRKMKERGEINRIFQNYYKNANSGHN
jgi:polar amino acid transport system substrate-binding protein